MCEIIYEDVEPNEEYEKTIKKVLEECYKTENLTNSKLIITITLTTPEKIRQINNEYRQIDKATDVLSFPMFEFYHLMGYDHIEEKDKIIMRPKEENVLSKLGITREKE